jgi:hypothetical protein
MKRRSDDGLSLAPVSPNVMHDFVDHYTAHGLLGRLEQCIVCMDIASLDIHQVSVEGGWRVCGLVR